VSLVYLLFDSFFNRVKSVLFLEQVFFTLLAFSLLFGKDQMFASQVLLKLLLSDLVRDQVSFESAHHVRMNMRVHVFFVTLVLSSLDGSLKLLDLRCSFVSQILDGGLLDVQLLDLFLYSLKLSKLLVLLSTFIVMLLLDL